MFTKYKFRKTLPGLGALVVATAMSGCAVSLPPAPQNHPAHPNAPEAATRPLRPRLVATSRSFLSPAADDREQKASQMDMKKTKQPGTQHDMSAMQHGSTRGISHGSAPSPGSAAADYTCPMHPEVKEAKPGNCPICGMTLVRKSAAKEGTQP